MWIHDWWSDEFTTTAKAVVATWKPDVVQIEMSVMAPYVHTLADCAPARVLTVYSPSVGRCLRPAPQRPLAT